MYAFVVYFAVFIDTYVKFFNVVMRTNSLIIKNQFGIDGNLIICHNLLKKCRFFSFVHIFSKNDFINRSHHSILQCIHKSRFNEMLTNQCLLLGECLHLQKKPFSLNNLLIRLQTRLIKWNTKAYMNTIIISQAKWC